MKPRLLDLCCGVGGATKGYQRAGFHVTGVDINPQPRYCGDEFVQDDAFSFLAKNGGDFDRIHTSFPCQASSALTKGNRGRGWADDHRDMNPAGRALLDYTGRPYVMENVQGSVLRRDLTLCGLMFGLRVFRHRYFEFGSLDAVQPAHPSHRGHRVAGWRHGVKYEGDMVAVYGDGGGARVRFRTGSRRWGSAGPATSGSWPRPFRLRSPSTWRGCSCPAWSWMWRHERVGDDG